MLRQWAVKHSVDYYLEVGKGHSGSITAHFSFSLFVCLFVCFAFVCLFVLGGCRISLTCSTSNPINCSTILAWTTSLWLPCPNAPCIPFPKVMRIPRSKDTLIYMGPYTFTKHLFDIIKIEACLQTYNVDKKCYDTSHNPSYMSFSPTSL